MIKIFKSQIENEKNLFDSVNTIKKQDHEYEKTFWDSMNLDLHFLTAHKSFITQDVFIIVVS